MKEPRFEVRFNLNAYKEYQKLDNSVVASVDKALEELQFRADEVGKFLANKHSTKIYGCKEIKLREAGIRIIYHLTNERVEVLQIVYVLSIEKRHKNLVFLHAENRYHKITSLPKLEFNSHLKKAKQWKSNKRSPKEIDTDRKK